MNKAMIIGRVGQDPEVRFTQSGKPVTNFSVATTERYRDGKGEKQENTTWHRVTAWGKLAETMGSFLKKGRQVYVEGRLETSKYKDKEGIERTSVEIVASNIEFLDSSKDKAKGASAGAPSGAENTPPQPEAEGDDIPF